MCDRLFALLPHSRARGRAKRSASTSARTCAEAMHRQSAHAHAHAHAHARPYTPPRAASSSTRPRRRCGAPTHAVRARQQALHATLIAARNGAGVSERRVSPCCAHTYKHAPALSSARPRREGSADAAAASRRALHKRNAGRCAPHQSPRITAHASVSGVRYPAARTQTRTLPLPRARARLERSAVAAAVRRRARHERGTTSRAPH
jgi:hypothetical protein